MMKFFRKYTKHLLAVFMALLLVVWLGGSAFTSLFQGGQMDLESVIGEAFGEPVRYIDRQVVSNQAEVLGSLGIPWNYIAARYRQEPLTYDEWFMLDLAAQKSGIYVSPENVALFRSNIHPQALEYVRKSYNISLERIDQILESFLRIDLMMRSAVSAVKISEADIQQFIRDAFEKAKIHAVIFPADKFIDESYQPTEEQIKEQFEKYKNVTSQPGNTLEFGYQIPEKVQVEYIKVNANLLKENQKITDEEAYDYWKEHKTEFTKPQTQPATQPSRESPKPYTTFTEAKPKVLEKLKDQRAKEEALRIANDLINQLSRPWANQPTTQPGNYKIPPDSQKSDKIYPNLIDQTQKKYSGILEYGRSKLVDQKSFRNVPNLGRASVFSGTQLQLSVGQAAFMVAGLEADPEETPKHARLFRSPYETCSEPATDVSGNAYVFRTVAAYPKQAPSSVDVVREQIIKDLRLPN